MLSQKVKTEFLQYFAAIIGSITTVGYGASLSWTSPAIPYLTSENSDISVSTEQSDRISSFLIFGFIIGYIINPMIIDRLGRKMILLTSALPQIIAWFIIIVAHDVVVIYIARISAGIGYGVGACATTIYLSEIGNQKTRGIFLAFINLSVSIGILFVMMLGAYLPYKYMNISLLMIPIIFVSSFSFMPDSSHFLEKRNEKQMEMNDLMDFESKNFQERVSIFNFKETRFWKLFSLTGNRRGVIIIVMLAAHDVFSGHMAVRFFSQQILSYGENFLSPEKATLILASTKIAACFLNTLIIERIKRRTLLLFSGFLAAFAQGIMTLFFFLEDCKIEVSAIGWLPIFGTALYELGLSIGIGNLYYVYQGEFFPIQVKSYAVTLCKIVYMIFTYFCLFRFQVLIEAFGPRFIFLGFTLSCLFFTLLLFKITPETKGRSLDEIQMELKSRKWFF